MWTEALSSAVVAAQGLGSLALRSRWATETRRFCPWGVEGGQVQGGVRTGRLPCDRRDGGCAGWQGLEGPGEGEGLLGHRRPLSEQPAG